jgi:UDP-3-O-[3-hydroxymyristoyl] glucosamine N-acyltransferase
MERTVREVAAWIQARVVGGQETKLRGIASIGSALPGDLVFVENERSLALAIRSEASAIVSGEFAGSPAGSKPLLICAHPRLAFARAAKLLCTPARTSAGIHSSAVVHASARLGAGTSIAAGAVIGADVETGENTRIGAGCVIGAQVRIGRDCDFHPHVTIYEGVRIGDRAIIHAGAVLGSDGFGYVLDESTGRREKFPQVGTLEIGDDVEIGANTTIDRGSLDATRIGRGSKIDNLVHIGHNCQLGENVVIAAQTGLSGSITLESDVILGGQVGVGEHARIEQGVMLGGQGGVLPHKVLRGKGVAFWGTPAKPLRQYLQQLAALSRLAKK